MRQVKLPVLYRAFVLRAWYEQTGTQGQSEVWRFSIQETGSPQRLGFDCLEALIAYLRSNFPMLGEKKGDGEET